MNSIPWETIAREFTFDGAWLDIYVFDAGLHAWQRVLDQLRHAGYELVYHSAGDVSGLPAAAADAFSAGGEADRTLSVKFAGVFANCHFFSRDEIEFDIDPREVRGQIELDALLAFMRLLSDATGRDAVLTPENLREIVVLRSHPRQSEVDYYEFDSGSRQNTPPTRTNNGEP